MGMLVEAIEGSQFLLILFEKGLLALVLLLGAFLFNLILQKHKLRAEAANKIASERANAYRELWKGLAAVRPIGSQDVTEEDARKLETFLVNWYHKEAFALYMSWGTARRYMLARRALDKRPIDSHQIRKSISRLGTQVKVDCGIYSNLQALLPLPKPPSSADNEKLARLKVGTTD